MTEAAEKSTCPLTRKTVTAYFEFIQLTMPIALIESFNFKAAKKRIDPPPSKHKPSKSQAVRR